MKKFFILFLILFFNSYAIFAASMFDDNGNYAGNWKQMTNVNQNSQKYKNSNYYTSSWKAQQNKRQNSPNYAQTVSSNKNDVVPFRYNTLNYSKYRKMHGANGDFKTKCMDIGDASFCH